PLLLLASTSTAASSPGLTASAQTGVAVPASRTSSTACAGFTFGTAIPSLACLTTLTALGTRCRRLGAAFLVLRCIAAAVLDGDVGACCTAGGRFYIAIGIRLPGDVSLWPAGRASAAATIRATAFGHATKLEWVRNGFGPGMPVIRSGPFRAALLVCNSCRVLYAEPGRGHTAAASRCYERKGSALWRLHRIAGCRA